jgi:hypothetical protein
VVLVVDMQNAFASKGGYLDLFGVDVSGAPDVIDRTRRVLGASRGAGMPVVSSSTCGSESWAVRMPTRATLPVRLPPGRARLATSLVATGSSVVMATIGMDPVAFFAAFAATVPAVMMTSTFAPTSSEANWDTRSAPPSAYGRRR